MSKNTKQSKRALMRDRIRALPRPTRRQFFGVWRRKWAMPEHNRRVRAAQEASK